MKIFDVDFNKLATLLLPTFLRRYKITLLLRACLFPLIELYNRFTENRKTNLYKINHNGQTCYLRAALNDEFDISQRRIKINNTVERRDPVMFHLRNENKPINFGTVIFSSRNFIGSQTADFIVLVPKEYKTDEIRIKAVLNYYKLISKRYIIEYF